MSIYLLLLNHFENKEGDEYIGMSLYQPGDEWEEDPDHPSRDIKDRPKDEVRADQDSLPSQCCEDKSKV
jgi:hypothetical protein